MTAEQKFYQKFRKLLPAGCDCVRVENSVQSGMPDLNLCHRGVEAWVELKVYEGGMVLIRPAQYAWGIRRAAAGGRSFIVALHPIGNLHLWMFPGVRVSKRGEYLLVSTEGCWDVVDSHHLSMALFQ